jgi:hypothetical protein
MKLFECQSCANPLYFENIKCERCHHQTGYVPDLETMSAVEPDGTTWIALADPESSHRYRFCANWEAHACNWLVPADATSPFCRACQHNRTIPDVSDPARHLLWRRMEEAKRRLIYSLIKLKLPTPSLASGEQEALVFDFLADHPEQKVMTGHEDGVITISLNEADDAAREQLRTSLHEPYRTVLGHFRHEVGHFYWDRLVHDGGHVESFRGLFGDERADYAEALKRYYENGPAPTWRENFVSAYATAHPWEDFAETWAHYLHIVDTLEMAYAFHLSVNPRVEEAPSTTVDRSPYRAPDIATLLAAWLPVTFAVNNLNRSMGQPDLYPFVISGAAISKLQYIHDLIRGALPKDEAVSREPVGKASSRPRWRWRDALTKSFRSMIGAGEKPAVGAERYGLAT